MVSAFAAVLVAIPLCAIYSICSKLLRNIAAAKRSGLPYIVTPFSPYNVFWLVTHKLWLPTLERLPWTESWLRFMTPNWFWELFYEPFKKMGETFLIVCPCQIILYTVNAEAIHQFTSRREDFPKPLKSYAILEIFGRNIVTTEGIEWRQHRKILASSFNEKNNALVFNESCAQARGMLKKWTGANGEGNITLEEVPTDTMRVTLHIISRVGFGVRLLWPGEEPHEEQSVRDAGYSSNDPSEGHSMSFENSLSTLLDNLLWVLLTPKWILKRIPFKGAQIAHESFINWGQYMQELFADKVEEAREGKQGEGMDIMGALVKSSYGSTPKASGKSCEDRAENGEAAKAILSDSDILGNAFVMLLAGHETTANSVHFSLVELATNPKSQRLVQKEVQMIFGDEPSENWDYDSSINALLGGIIGGVLNEELRLMPPVIAVPKSVGKGQDQIVIIDGKKYTLPAGAHINLNAVGVHRNPRYWPTQPSKFNDAEDDLNDFKPERWLVKVGADGVKQADTSAESSDDDDFGGFTGHDSHAQLFRPVRGSFIPFSEGGRSCLGRRLAQVEVMAVLAVLLQNYSIELAVDEWATDEEVAKMSPEERKEVYKKAQTKSRGMIRGATAIITLKLHMHPGYIPVRMVKKGEERFINIID